MLKVLQVGTLFLGLSFFLALAGLAYYSSSPPAYPSEQQAAAQSAEKKPQEKEHSLRGFVNFLFPDAISIFTFWLVIATIVLGIIAYVQIDFLRRAEDISTQTAKAAKDSADIAKDALVAANRPWIQVQAQVGGPIFYNVNGVNITINYHLKNIGHSPATNVFVDAHIFAPAIGVDGGSFNARDELDRIIAATNARPQMPLGFPLFPDEFAIQAVTVSINADELKRITQKVEFILPSVIGAVTYRMGFDNKVHHTGFIIEVRRSDRPRPESTAKNRAPQTIFPDDGDIPADDVRLIRSFFEGGYAD
jgi:hypothetical protein